MSSWHRLPIHLMALRLVFWILLSGMIVVPRLAAETFKGCNWAGLDPNRTLDRALFEIDLKGSLGSDLISFLHEVGVPISFISMADDEPKVRIRHTGTISIRELLEDVLTQAPGYRLEIVSSKLVLYPLNEDFDMLVDLGELREANRVAAWLSTIRTFDSTSAGLSGLRTAFSGSALVVDDTSHAPSDNNPWEDQISIGGVRPAIEHLVSLIAGSPSAAFMIGARSEGWRNFSLTLADVVADLLLEAPERVKVGDEIELYPRIILNGGEQVTLIGTECGVAYQSVDDSIQIDERGRAVAIAKGSSGIYAFYEGKGVFAEFQVFE